MNKLLSPSFWVNAFISTFMTCLFIYLLKKMTAKVNVPVVSNIMQEV